MFQVVQGLAGFGQGFDFELRLTGAILAEQQPGNGVGNGGFSGPVRAVDEQAASAGRFEGEILYPFEIAHRQFG